jgi:hypothetical protein
MKATTSYSGVVFWIATIAVSNTVTAHITRTNNANEVQNRAVDAATIRTKNVVDVNQAMSAPYRDGLFMAKRNQERGEFVQASVGRWSTAADRATFSAGYDHAYETASLSGE